MTQGTSQLGNVPADPCPGSEQSFTSGQVCKSSLNEGGRGACQADDLCRHAGEGDRAGGRGERGGARHEARAQRPEGPAPPHRGHALRGAHRRRQDRAHQGAPASRSSCACKLGPTHSCIAAMPGARCCSQAWAEHAGRGLCVWAEPSRKRQAARGSHYTAANQPLHCPALPRSKVGRSRLVKNIRMTEHLMMTRTCLRRCWRSSTLGTAAP